MTMVKAVALSMLLSMTTQSAGATAMSAQNLKVTLNVTNTTVKGAIDRIEKTEGYVFVYTSDLLPELNAQVSLQASNRNIDEVLERLFAKTNIAYKR